MMPNTIIEKKKLCSDCGTDITKHANYNRWTQCARCYWSGKNAKLPPVEALLKDRNDTQHKSMQIHSELENAERELKEKERIVKKMTPWWMHIRAFTLSIFNIELEDAGLLLLRKHVYQLRYELNGLQSHIEYIESRVKTARQIRKAFDSASKDASLKRQREQEQALAKRAFDENSRGKKISSFDRSLFTIRNIDYKRGNQLENHFRNGFLQTAENAH
jgi:ribosomal protein S27AE